MVEATIVNFLIENQIIVIISVLFVILGAKVLGGRESPNIPEFRSSSTAEYKKIEEMTLPYLEKLLDSKGEKMGVDFYEEKTNDGYIVKRRTITESEKPIRIDFNKRSKKKTDDNIEGVELDVLEVINDGSKKSRLKNKIKNSLPLTSGDSEIRVVRKDLVKESSPDKYVIERTDWDYDAGFWITNGSAERNIKKRKAMNETTNQLLEGLPEFVKNVRTLNPHNALAIAREEAKKEDDSKSPLG